MAPFILKVRQALALDASEAAAVLNINIDKYLAMESSPDRHFDRDQLIELWNWMTPKMIDIDAYVKLLDEPDYQ